MTRTDTAVLLVLVDGLRHDYLNPADAPFLHELSRNNWSCRLHETYAFELRPAFLAGLHPEECGIANMFLHDPKGSPFAGLDLENMDRAAIDLAVKEVERGRGHSASAHYAFSAAIPRDLLPRFAFAETHLTWEEGALGGHPTLFDHLRKAGKKWLWLAYPDGDLRAGPLVQAFEERLEPDHSLIFLHFGELDWVGHEAGPGSAPTREKLREIDQALARVFSRLNRTRSEVRSIVFGDHGMVSVERTMDMAGILAQTGLRLGEDYLYFLDSTQARFWFRQEGARERVLAALQDHPEGRFLAPSDLERLRYRFPDHRYGQEIFAVREGTVLFPNFFQDSAPPKGMHGYLPEVEANWSAAILTGATGEPSPSEAFDLTGLYPTVLELLDLPLPPSPAPLPVDLYPPAERTLTALIPTRNRAEILGLCLEALGREARGLEQEVEIIVVDDGSSDTTEATVSESRKSFPDLRINCLRQDPAGPGAARNRGLREARGRLILFMNDDTIAETGFLRDHMAWHDQHPALGAALLGDLSWDGAITPTPFRGWLLRDGPLCALDGLPEEASLDYRYFVTANLSVKHVFLKRHGFFDEDFRKPMLEDTELGYRLQLQGLDLHLHRSARGRHRHEIRLADFCRRQELVGRETYLFLQKHPELVRQLLPRLGRPLLPSTSRPVQEIMARLDALEERAGADFALEDSDPAKLLLSRLYFELLETLRLEGFLAALDEAHAVSSETHWGALGLSGLPPSLRFLLEAAWRRSEEEQEAPRPAPRDSASASLFRELDDLRGRLHRSGLAYQDLEQRHRDLLDSYQERQSAVERLAARLEAIEARPEERVGNRLRLWARRLRTLFGANR